MGKVSLADKMRIQKHGPIDKAVNDFSKGLKLRFVLKLAVDTSNIHSDNGIMTSDH